MYFKKSLRLIDNNSTRLIQYDLEGDKYKRISIVKRIFNITAMIFSICGLLYQAQIIYSMYISGKTVVGLEIGRLLDDTPPALTLCYSALFSMERSAKFQPSFEKINKRYQDLLIRNNSSLI